MRPARTATPARRGRSAAAGRASDAYAAAAGRCGQAPLGARVRRRHRPLRRPQELLQGPALSRGAAAPRHGRRRRLAGTPRRLKPARPARVLSCAAGPHSKACALVQRGLRAQRERERKRERERERRERGRERAWHAQGTRDGSFSLRAQRERAESAETERRGGREGETE